MKISAVIQAVTISTTLMLALTGCANSATCSADYEAQLASQAATAFTAVREGEGAAFLRHIGDQGLTLNGVHVSSAELTQQFESKKGIYCELFNCNGQPGRFKAAFSSRGASQTQYDAHNRVALILIAANTNDELMVTFKYSMARCVWEVVDITTP